MMIGDVVVAIDGKTTREPNDVQAVLSPDLVGTTITVTIVRGDERRNLTLVVGGDTLAANEMDGTVTALAVE